MTFCIFDNIVRSDLIPSTLQKQIDQLVINWMVYNFTLAICDIQMQQDQ